MAILTEDDALTILCCQSQPSKEVKVKVFTYSFYSFFIFLSFYEYIFIPFIN